LSNVVLGAQDCKATSSHDAINKPMSALQKKDEDEGAKTPSTITNIVSQLQGNGGIVNKDTSNVVIDPTCGSSNMGDAKVTSSCRCIRSHAHVDGLKVFAYIVKRGKSVPQSIIHHSPSTKEVSNYLAIGAYIINPKKSMSTPKVPYLLVLYINGLLCASHHLKNVFETWKPLELAIQCG
jgi:hypothetical protein